MKVKELIAACENIAPATCIMVYATVEDYDLNTAYWQDFTAEQLKDCENLVSKFKVLHNMVVVALA